jgi:F420-0:gamma-glutamyl ligase
MLQGAEVAADVENVKGRVAAGEEVVDQAAGEGVPLVVVEGEVEERVLGGNGEELRDWG